MHIFGIERTRLSYLELHTFAPNMLSSVLLALSEIFAAHHADGRKISIKTMLCGERVKRRRITKMYNH